MVYALLLLLLSLLLLLLLLLFLLLLLLFCRCFFLLLLFSCGHTYIIISSLFCQAHARFVSLELIIFCVFSVCVLPVQALYGTSSSEGFNYVSYIYLLAPVSLAIINPIGFTCMEFQKQLSSKTMSIRQVSSYGNSVYRRNYGRDNI